MLNHAFIIQVHKQPELFKRIVKRLAAPNHYIFVNVDKKVSDTAFKKAVVGIDNIVFLKDEGRTDVRWGGFSQIACTLQLLKKVLTYPIAIDYIHSLSGQDYPCVSNEAFDRFFEEHDGESFMMFDSPEEHKEWSKPRGKYEERYMRWHFNDRPGYMKLLEKPIRLIERFHYIRSAIPNVRAGWSWFTWHRSVVEYVLRYCEEHPSYMKRFHDTSCCDELIFHTFLYPHFHELRIHPDNCLRYIDWHPSRPYEGRLPLILDERDYNSVLCSGALFCRKVDEKHSGKLLDMLDKLLVKEF